MRALVLLLSLAACKSGQRDGTFIGNPSLTARYIDNEVQVGRGGTLDSDELHVHGCDRMDDVALGPTAFAFEGALSVDTEQIPTGHYCELFLVVKELTVTFDQPGVGEISITGRDYDLLIPADFTAAEDEHYVVELGDEDWLADMVPFAQAGVNEVSDNEDLREAYFEGLSTGSAVLNNN